MPLSTRQLSTEPASLEANPTVTFADFLALTSFAGAFVIIVSGGVVQPEARPASEARRP